MYVARTGSDAVKYLDFWAELKHMPLVVDEDIVFNNPTSVLIMLMKLTKIMMETKKITISSKI